MRETKYQIEYLIDQRKCDIFTVLISALNILEKDREANGYTVGKVVTMKEGNIYTIQVSFTESQGS